MLTKKSLKVLETADPKLILLVDEVSKEMDLWVYTAYRGEKAQNEAFASGASELKFPDSTHNKLPSKAIDCGPLTEDKTNIDWTNEAAFIKMRELFYKASIKLGIPIKKIIKLKKGYDYPHIELA